MDTNFSNELKKVLEQSHTEAARHNSNVISALLDVGNCVTCSP